MGAEVGGRFVTEVPVRWSDLDAFGHVNNARTVTLLEEARVDWLFVTATAAGAGRMTSGIVVSRLSIDYRRPIPFESPITVSMGVPALGAASFTVDYRLTLRGTEMATAETVLVPIASGTGAPRRLDEAERAYLSVFRGA